MNSPVASPLRFALPPRHIACATDLATGSREAEAAAIEVARRFQSRLTFVFIDPTFVYHAELLMSSGGLASPRFDPDKQKAYLERRASELRAHIAPLAEGVPFEVVTDSGDPSIALLAWMQTADGPAADLIVLGRKRRGALESLFMGSTATNVLEEARVPVLMVPEGTPARNPLSARDVVLASDLAAIDTHPAEAAALFARAWDGHVTIVNAFETQDYRPLPPEYFASEDVYHELTELVVNATRVKKDHIAKDAERLSQKFGVRCEGLLLEGAPKETILAHVKTAKPGLLVVGRWTRRGALGTWLLGSTARALAMHAQCPVLVVPHEV